MLRWDVKVAIRPGLALQPDEVTLLLPVLFHILLGALENKSLLGSALLQFNKKNTITFKNFNLIQIYLAELDSSKNVLSLLLFTLLALLENGLRHGGQFARCCWLGLTGRHQKARFSQESETKQ